MIRILRSAVLRWPLLLLLGACAAPPPVATPPAPAPAAAPAAELPVAAAYVPPPGDDWARRSPAEAGMDSAALAAAVAFAVEHETPWPTDLRAALGERLASGEFGEIVGPVKDRGEPNGMILRGGYLVAEWGETRRVDMTFSISKSYLATTAGLALDEGLIRDLEDPVRSYVPDSLFAGRNAPITWYQLLHQTSEWQGTLWGKPDLADRREGVDRTLHEPGTFWEYNDVRVNLAALSLLEVWERPLPEVLRERVMDPIGASDSWQWHGYRTSYTPIAGRRVQSVSGGGHWGGGVWISTRDHARFGLLYLRDGLWGERRIFSPRWVELATTPTALKPTYGAMWWLNTDRELYPSAPASSYFALGAGTNLIWIDPEHDLVAVVRWIDNSQVDGFIARVMAALGEGGAAAQLPPVGDQAATSAALAGPILPRASWSSSAGSWTSPAFTTQRTSRVARISASGLPATTIRSAHLPVSMEPSRADTPRARAPLIVAARSAAAGGMPASTSACSSRWIPKGEKYCPQLGWSVPTVISGPPPAS